MWHESVSQRRLSAGASYTPEQVQRNMARNVSGKASQEAVAPYQALPVQGPVITHHMTPALEVIEPGTASEEVGTTSLPHMHCCWIPARAAIERGTHVKMPYQQPVQGSLLQLHCGSLPPELSGRGLRNRFQLVSHLGW